MTARYVAMIRHGDYHQAPDTPSALQPYPLTETGRRQARDCGAALSGWLADHGAVLAAQAYCSRQLRAWETARIALDRLELDGHAAQLVEHGDLSERTLGSAANLTVAQIESVMAADPRHALPPQGWKSDSDYCLPLHGAESLMKAGERVALFLRRVMAQTAPPDTPTLTLFFGHGASFRHAAHLLGVMERDQIAQVSMYHARPLLLCYMADDTWVHCDGAWKPRGKADIRLD